MGPSPTNVRLALSAHWDTLCIIECTGMPFILGSECTEIAKTSAIRIYNDGDSGSPCRTPCCM